MVFAAVEDTIGGGVMNARDLIQKFSLEPHPEGGYFKETYRSEDVVDCSLFEGGKRRFGRDDRTGQLKRNTSTGIYFLLPEGSRSCLHRIKSDEMWHFYLGGPMCVVEIDEGGKLTETILGQDIVVGQVVQHVVPAGVWFGGYPLDGTDYSFVGCTVAPGFDFSDFELADRESMMKSFPQHVAMIKRLTL